MGSAHIGVGLEDLKCHQLISNSLNQSVSFWMEADSSHAQAVAHVINELLVDESEQSFQSLSKESQDFFRTKLEEKVFQQMSYYGLLIQINSLCKAEQKEFLQQQVLLHANKIEDKKLDVQIHGLAQSQNIPQNYLDEENNLQELFKSQLKALSVKHVEEAIKDYNENCSHEKIAQKLEWIFNKLQEIIQKYKEGEDFDVLVVQKENLKKWGLSEDVIKAQEDVFIHGFLRKRNEIWLRKLLSAHNQQQSNTSQFVVAGLAHFTGYFNVLDMLKGEGFSVKRFNADCTVE